MRQEEVEGAGACEGEQQASEMKEDGTNEETQQPWVPPPDSNESPDSNDSSVDSEEDEDEREDD